MNTINLRRGTERAGVSPAHAGGVRDWQRWAPYAAVAWSLIYAALGVYWAVGGRGFPYPADTVSDPLGPLVGRFGPGVAWLVVMMAGLPTAALGVAMLRGVRSKTLRPLFITAGALLAGVLLLLMTGLNLLVTLGYVPYAIRSLLTADEFGQRYLAGLAQWTMIHQWLCLVGGFLWLGATVIYARRSGDACVYCGRRNGPEGWQSANQAVRWGRIAVYVTMVAPVFYAFTRYAWALGFPLGMSEEYLRRGQESGTWVSGLFLATFGLLGACLMLGLVQHWGEVFPRWMLGLSGRRVPIALAVVPAALASVLLIVGGIGIWSDLGQMVAALVAGGAEGMEIVGAVIFQVGPTLLFPIWGIALAVATLGYYYRRRGPCRVCGRGAAGEAISERGQSVTTITAFIKQHALLIYFVLVFAISFGSVLIVVGSRGLPITLNQSDPLFLLAMLAFLLGPALAGPLLTGLLDGRAGLRELLSRLLRWRVGARWYAVALLTAPLLATAVALALSLRSLAFLPVVFTADDKTSLLLMGIAVGLVVGIFEELGWTGFAIPRLRQRYGVLATGLIVGMPWGAWHFLMFWESDSFSGALPLAILLVRLFSWLPAYRVLMVWVYDRTESLLLAMLMHVSLAAISFIFAAPTTGADLLLSLLAGAAAWWVVVAGVAVANHGHFSRPAARTQMA